MGAIDSIEEHPDDLVIRGWAVARRGVPRAVVITTNGVARAVVHTHGGTAQHRKWGRAIEFWQAVIRRKDLGSLTISIGAIVDCSNDVSFRIAPQTVALPTEVLIGAVDQPAPGEVIKGATFMARGWFRTSVGFSHLEMFADGQYLGRPRLMSAPRPDVASILNDSDAPLAGFETWFELPARLTEKIVLRTDAVSDDTRVVIDSRTVLIHAEGEYRAVSDSHRLNVLRARTRESAESLSARGSQRSGCHALVVTHHLGLGGGQLYLQELLIRLMDEPDFSCSVFSSEDGVLRSELESLGAEVQIVGFTPTDSLVYEQWMRQMVAIAAPYHADVVIANTAGSYWGVDLATRLGWPSLWAIHESFTPEVFLKVGFGTPPDEGVQACFLNAFAQASAVIFEADATLQLFQDRIRPGRAIRVDYGIDLQAIQSERRKHERFLIRRQLGIGEDEVLLLCMGTFEARKAQGLLAVAFSRIADEFPGATLCLVGDRDAPYSTGVHQVVDRLPCSERIRMIPVTPDIYEWYAAADAFVLVSDIESLPRSMMEAMAFGLPVIGPAVFGIPELIEDGVTGILFEPSSVDSAAAALRRFLSTEASERLRLAEAGRRLIQTHRSSKGYAYAYRNLIEQVSTDPDAIAIAADA